MRSLSEQPWVQFEQQKEVGASRLHACSVQSRSSQGAEPSSDNLKAREGDPLDIRMAQHAEHLACVKAYDDMMTQKIMQQALMEELASAGALDVIVKTPRKHRSVSVSASPDQIE